MRKYWLLENAWTDLDIDLTVEDLMADLDPWWLPAPGAGADADTEAAA